MAGVLRRLDEASSEIWTRGHLLRVASVTYYYIGGGADHLPVRTVVLPEQGLEGAQGVGLVLQGVSQVGRSLNQAARQLDLWGA